mgnify:FL=1
MESLRMAWLVTRTPGSGAPFALFFSEKDRKYVEKYQKM